MAERVGISPVMETASADSASERAPQAERPNRGIDRFLHLQQAIGNQATLSLLAGGLLQPKLRIGPVDDVYEREADRTADRVMRMPDPDADEASPLQAPISRVQRMCAECEEEEGDKLRRQVQDEEEEVTAKEEDDEPLQRQATVSGAPPVDVGIESHIASLRGGGQPLPPSARSSFEPRFGHEFRQASVHYGSFGVNQPKPTPASAMRMADPLKRGLEALSGMDLSDVRVHRNSSEPSKLNAFAYAQGRDIYVGPRQEKHLPHEGWHAVQQMQGRVKPTMRAKGVSINDDKKLEREADVMGARALVNWGHAKTGERVEANPAVPVQRVPDGTVVQRVPSHYGEFKDAKYDTVSRGGLDVGVDIKIEFHPDKKKVDAEKIGLTQTVHNTLLGTDVSFNPTRAEQRVKSGVGKGRRIDRLSTRTNPLYGTGPSGPTDDLGDTPTTAGSQYGWHYFDATGAEKTQEALLHDRPTLLKRGNNSGQSFETAALAVEGTQKGTYMGSVEWGWQVDGSGTFSKIPFKIVSKGVPTAGFMAAAELWNKSTARGTMKTVADPTDVYKWSGGFVKDYTVPKDTEAELLLEGNVTYNNKLYNKVKIKSTGNIGFIITSDMKDKGGGGATIDLPLVDVHVIKSTGGVTLTDSSPTANLPLADGTRVEILDATHLYEPAADNTDPHLEMYQIKVVHGPNTGETGWVNYRLVKDESP